MNEIFVKLYLDSYHIATVNFSILPRIGETIKYNNTLYKVETIVHLMCDMEFITQKGINIYLKQISEQHESNNP